MPVILIQTSDNQKYLKSNVEPDHIAPWLKEYVVMPQLFFFLCFCLCVYVCFGGGVCFLYFLFYVLFMMQLLKILKCKRCPSFGSVLV